MQPYGVSSARTGSGPVLLRRRSMAPTMPAPCLVGLNAAPQSVGPVKALSTPVPVPWRQRRSRPRRARGRAAKVVSTSVLMKPPVATSPVRSHPAGCAAPGDRSCSAGTPERRPPCAGTPRPSWHRWRQGSNSPPADEALGRRCREAASFDTRPTRSRVIPWVAAALRVGWSPWLAPLRGRARSLSGTVGPISDRAGTSRWSRPRRPRRAPVQGRRRFAGLGRA